MTKLLNWDECLDKKIVGNKAYSLYLLKKNNFLVPDFKVIPLHEKITLTKDIIDFTNLISVRSGSPVSMPGLMVSFLNVTQSNVLEKMNLVKESWNNEITNEVKKHLKIDPNLDTAVILQKMVPKDILLGSGVASTIHPITKTEEAYISFKKNIYGDEVVINGGSDQLPEEQRKELLNKLKEINNLFEKEQEVEFCLTNKGFYFLQSRDLVISQEKFSEEITGTLIGQGLGSNQGVVTGRACFENPSKEDILCVKTLNPNEIQSLIACRAVVARKGDHNSHLAVLCRLLNKPYILSASLFQKIVSGQKISLNTDSGEIYS